MEPTKLQSDDFKEQVSKISSSHPPEGTGMHRDNESIDDFEHLDPESSPVKEFHDQGPQNKVDKPSGEEPGVLTDVSHIASAISQSTSDFSFQPASTSDSTMDDKYNSQFGDEKLSSSAAALIDSATPLLGGSDFVKSSELPEKIMFSQQPHDLLGFSTEASVKPETESLISTGEKRDPRFESEFDIGKLSKEKAHAQAFIDTERGVIITEGTVSHQINPTDVPELDVGNLPSENYPADDLTSSFSHDFEKRHEDIHDSDTLLNPLKSDIKHKEKLSDEIGSSKSSLSAQEDDELPSQEEPEPDEPTSVPASTHPKLTPSAPEPIKPVAVPDPSLKPETVVAVEPNIKPLPDKSTSPSCPLKTKPAVDDSDLEEVKPIQLFHYMGLDAWFKPDRLHPKVVELVYWRDPKKSGIVFGTVLGVLLSLSYFSLISVVAYLSLALLTGTISFRIYKNVLQAVQKTSDGHPFKDILELNLTLPQDKVREVTDIAVAHVNAAALELRRLFLVEDLVDSIKFGVLLWCLTYVGSWFNGMTLIIIAFVALFTLPKVYEHNKAQIDQNLDIVRSKVADITSKVKAAIPIGKKPAAEEEKKDQ